MSEQGIQIGDRVKLILDKEVSPDNQWHGKTGRIIDVSFDDAASVTDDPKDNFMYKIELEDGIVPDVHFRRADIVLID
jgi:ribosomal protein L21E